MGFFIGVSLQSKLTHHQIDHMYFHLRSQVELKQPNPNLNSTQPEFPSGSKIQQEPQLEGGQAQSQLKFWLGWAMWVLA